MLARRRRRNHRRKMRMRNFPPRIPRMREVYGKCSRLQSITIPSNREKKVTQRCERNQGGFPRGSVPFELFLPMFSLSMTSSSHVTLRSSGCGKACKCNIRGDGSLCVSSGAGVTVCDPVVGVPSRACIRCMISKCSQLEMESR